MTTSTTEIEQIISDIIESPRDAIADLCDRLAELGRYKSTPFMESYKYSAQDMVLMWGADWDTFREPLTCLKCGADLRNTETGPPFKLEIGIVNNDRLEYFQCPKCNGKL
jgi:DNA-directed RNA polymerase subunit RPC12/RpoP